MSLRRTRTALEIIKAQVASELDSFMQSCLAQYLAVVFYSEMEERITDIVGRQLQQFTSKPIGLYLTRNIEKIIRRTKKSEIEELLHGFGEEFADRFRAKVPQTDVVVYSNVITARHNIGHKQGSNITLVEIEKGIAAAEKILNALEECFQ